MPLGYPRVTLGMPLGFPRGALGYPGLPPVPAGWYPGLPAYFLIVFVSFFRTWVYFVHIRFCYVF